MRSGEAFQSGRKEGKGRRKDEKWESLLIEGEKKGKGEGKTRSGEAFQRGGGEKGKGKTRSGEDFQRGREKRKGGRNDISRK